MQFHITSIENAFRNLAEIITTASVTTNASFPFVTVPMWEVYASQARLQSGAEIFAFTPIVEEAEMGLWANYSNSHQGWLQESRNLQQNRKEVVVGSSYLNDSVAPWIYEHEPTALQKGEFVQIRPPGPGPYTPFWQVSPPPVNPAFIGYNFLAESFARSNFEVVMKVKGKKIQISARIHYGTLTEIYLSMQKRLSCLRF